MLVASPVLAQSIYTHEPTPEERVQTNNLNTEAADQAKSDTDAFIQARDNYDADRDRYERSLDDYRANRDSYDRQRDNYEDQRALYDRDRQQRWRGFENYGRYRAIYRFHSEDMVGLTVYARDGERLGRIRDVNFAPDGRVNRIAISTGWHRTAWVYADDVRYDPVTHEFLIDLSRDQVWRLSRMREFGT
jgi:sporulation protein YlmC with PRC-barrel domain